MKLTATTTSEVEITPEQMAELFWGMDADQQAKFFGHLGVVALATPAPFTKELGSFFGLDWQMYHAAISAHSTPLAKRVMEIIGGAASGSAMLEYHRTRCPVCGRELNPTPDAGNEP